jgi:O-acetyl-ADP-ribose deacetylase (regulator of RNase III)
MLHILTFCWLWQVSVVRRDITVTTTEGVVSAVDGRMTLAGGVSRDIARAVGGQVLEDQCAQYIRTKGRLSVTQLKYYHSHESHVLIAEQFLLAKCNSFIRGCYTITILLYCVIRSRKVH